MIGTAMFLAVVARTAYAKKLPQPLSATASSSQSAVDKFKSAGKGAALTVYPTRMAGTAVPKVGEVIALMLEKGGMNNLETSEKAFTPPEGADLGKTALAFGEFIKANPPTTEYALFTAFELSREKGVSEVSGVVVNRQGEVVWKDRQVKGDKDFDTIKPREPMQCCILVAERLRPVLGLDDPTNSKAAPGKLAERWRKESGVPDKAEMKQIEKRESEFKKHAANSTLGIYPSHAGESFSPESAASISGQINNSKLAKAVTLDKGPQPEIARGMNEQMMLWSMAQSFSDYVKKNPPTTDYVLFADYLMAKNGVVGVHFAICNKQGELVVVDLQNNHWPDFNAIKPKAREECDKLVVKRLEGYCR